MSEPESRREGDDTTGSLLGVVRQSVWGWQVLIEFRALGKVRSIIGDDVYPTREEAETVLSKQIEQILSDFKKLSPRLKVLSRNGETCQ